MSEETHSEHEHSHNEHEHHEHHESQHYSHHEGDSGKKKIMGLDTTTVALFVIVIGVLLIALVFMNSGSAPVATPTPAASVTPFAGKVDLALLQVKVKNFLDSQFLASQGMTSKIINATEKNGLYELGVEISDGTQTVDSAIVFVTLDGKRLLLGNSVDLVEATPVPSPTPVPKSDKPDVKLFVMSMCPYGTTAEYAMIPVIKLLGDKASFDIRFIANAGPNGTFQSLHGQPEVVENLRQVCIAANQPDKFLAYLECFVKAPAEAINANDGAAYAAVNWTKMASECLTQAKVNVANVTACINGAQGAELLTKNIALATELGVQSSPTIKVNGGDFKGERSSEALKQGVCNAFNTAPSECAQELSSAVGTSSSVGCG